MSVIIGLCNQVSPITWAKADVSLTWSLKPGEQSVKFESKYYRYCPKIYLNVLYPKCQSYLWASIPVSTYHLNSLNTESNVLVISYLTKMSMAWMFNFSKVLVMWRPFYSFISKHKHELWDINHHAVALLISATRPIICIYCVFLFCCALFVFAVLMNSSQYLPIFVRIVFWHQTISWLLAQKITW